MTRGGASGGGAGRGDRKGRRPPQSRDVTISRNLSYLLRHNAASEGVSLDEGGWANVADVLLWRKLSSLKVTLTELKQTVATNDKQRYQLKSNPNNSTQTPDSNSTEPSHFLIRASQGHSIATITSENLLNPVLATDADCPHLVVHGTDLKSWDLIQSSGGLKAMTRNHIHFASREPKKLKGIGEETEVCRTRDLTDRKDQLLSGMRQGATVLMWVDVKKSLEGGVKWWRSENGVYLTEGLDKGNGEKILGFEWFRWVERRGETMQVLWKAEGGNPETEKVENEMRGLRVGGQSRVGRDGVVEASGEKVRGEERDGIKVEKVEIDGPVKENWDD